MKVYLLTQLRVCSMACYKPCNAFSREFSYFSTLSLLLENIRALKLFLYLKFDLNSVIKMLFGTVFSKQVLAELQP